jgi:hypothetical protein
MKKLLTFDDEEMDAAYNGEVDNIKVPEEISNKYKDSPIIWGIPYGCNECARFTNYILTCRDEELMRKQSEKRLC